MAWATSWLAAALAGPLVIGPLMFGGVTAAIVARVVSTDAVGSCSVARWASGSATVCR